VWLWEPEQRWFTGDPQDASEDIEAKGIDANTLSVHGIIREWARLHPENGDLARRLHGQVSHSADLRSLYQGFD